MTGTEAEFVTAYELHQAHGKRRPQVLLYRCARNPEIDMGSAKLAEQLAQLQANATGPNSLTGIAFNRNHPEAVDLQELPNHRVVRELGPASVGGIGTARGLADFYAAAIDGRLLKPDTIAAVGQIHSAGADLVTRQPAAFGLGFSSSATAYPVLGQGAFGHPGATGTEAFADPRNGIAYGYVRRRFGFPAGPGPENQGLVRALHAAATPA